MQGEFIKGDIKDVCAELEAEAKRNKGMKLGTWLKMRVLEKEIAKQFGITVEEYRRELHGDASK